MNNMQEIKGLFFGKEMTIITNVELNTMNVVMEAWANGIAHPMAMKKKISCVNLIKHEGDTYIASMSDGYGAAVLIKDNNVTFETVVCLYSHAIHSSRIDDESKSAEVWAAIAISIIFNPEYNTQVHNEARRCVQDNRNNGAVNIGMVA